MRGFLRDRFIYRRLAFAEPAESIVVARTAMQVRPGDSVAGVTSSGDLLPALLHDGASQIHGFDANPTQTAIAVAKVHIRENLSLNDGLKLLGLKDATPDQRLAIWHTLLSVDQARELSIERRHAAEGLLNAGMSTRLARGVLTVLRSIASSADYQRLVASGTTDAERLAVFQSLRDNWRYRYGVQPFTRANGRWLQYFLFPPAICANSDYPRRALQDLLAHFARLFEVGFHDNPVFCRHLTGNLPQEHIENLYSAEAWEAIGKCASQVKFDTLAIDQGLLRLESESVDAIYLSNVPDYLRPDGLERLQLALIHAARVGARVYYLSLDPSCPFERTNLRWPFHRSSELECALTEIDNVGLYPFLGVLIRE